MKKVFVFTTLILILLVSCATTGNREAYSSLSKLGNDGDLIFTGKTSADKVDRVNICVSENEVYGTVEGSFSRLEASVAAKSFDGYSFYVPKKGFLVFSDKDAKAVYKMITEKEEYLSDYDASLMKNSDYAVYMSDTGKLKGFFTSLKASYVSYLTKNSIKVDYSSLNQSFVMYNNVICVNNLPVDAGYLKSFAEEFLHYGRN